MTLDERLEFTARNIRSLRQAISENARQIAEVSRRVDERFERVFGMIQKRVEVAEIHERRIRA
jgi:hypothetical protein